MMFKTIPLRRDRQDGIIFFDQGHIAVEGYVIKRVFCNTSVLILFWLLTHTHVSGTTFVGIGARYGSSQGF